MISLRHHIFSLVAVFVALAIGIAAGSTVVRGPLLDSLRARLESAESVIEDERAENDRLAAEVAQLDQLGDDAPEQLLPGRLQGSAVLLVVAGNVAGDVVAGLVRSIEAASAEFLGEMRIDPAVFDPEQSERIVAAIGLATTDGRAPTSEEAQEAFGRTVGALLDDVAAGIQASGEVTEVVSSTFGALEDEGLVDLLRMRTAPVEAQTFDIVLLNDRNSADDPALVLRQIVEHDDDVTAPRPVAIVAEVGRIATDNDSPSPSFVAAVRASGRLRDEVSTVDNAETVLGWIATVLGLQRAQQGDIGHYGFRDGAERSIPGAPQ